MSDGTLDAELVYLDPLLPRSTGEHDGVLLEREVQVAADLQPLGRLHAAQSGDLLQRTLDGVDESGQSVRRDHGDHRAIGQELPCGVYLRPTEVVSEKAENDTSLRLSLEHKVYEDYLNLRTDAWEDARVRLAQGLPPEDFDFFVFYYMVVQTISRELRDAARRGDKDRIEDIINLYRREYEPLFDRRIDELEEKYQVSGFSTDFLPEGMSEAIEDSDEARD